MYFIIKNYSNIIQAVCLGIKTASQVALAGVQEQDNPLPDWAMKIC